MFDQKGQIRIIEAFLSVAVIFSALLVSVTFPSTSNLIKQKSLANTGIQALMKFDANGTLGSLIVQQKWAYIMEGLDVLLPVGVSFNLTVYDANGRQINPQVIQNSNLLSGEAVSVQYVCATQSENVEFFVLHLQLAWAS